VVAASCEKADKGDGGREGVLEVRVFECRKRRAL